MTNTDQSKIAIGYAESLMGLAKLENLEDRLEGELFELKRVLEKNYDLRSFLENKDIEVKAKKKAIDELLSPDASRLLHNELNLLIDQKRADLIPDIAEAFIDIMKREKNRVLAEVVTAVPLTDQTKEKVASHLKKVTGKNVAVKNIVDSDVLAGMLVRIEGKIIDLSVRKQLQDLTNQ